MSTLIIQINKGGLGDHLFFSHLPRIAKQTGKFTKVLFSKQSFCRHPHTMQLVWESNTWLDGFTEDSGTYFFPAEIALGTNLLDAIMLGYGLDDGQRFHEPEIYYTPKLIESLNEAIIYDPNYISYTGNLTSGKNIQQWFTESNIHVDFQMKSLGGRYLPISNAHQELATADLFELCNVLVSCKRMYCLTTGTATLAAALGKSVTVFYGTGHDPLYRHSKLHSYQHVGTDFKLKDYLLFYATKLLQIFIPVGKR